MSDIETEIHAEGPRRAPSRLQRAWDSDFLYAFRRSPVAVVATLTVTLMVLARCSRRSSRRTTRSIRRR